MRLRNTLLIIKNIAFTKESIFTLIFTINLIGLFPAIPSAIVMSMCILLVLLYASKKYYFDRTAFIFSFYLPLNIIISQPSPLFHSWERLILFFAVFFAVSPIIQSEYARETRRKLLNRIIIVCSIFAVLSFFAYFLGINFMSRGEQAYDMEQYIESAGKFSGLFRHSMTLAPVAGWASLFFLYMGFIKKHKYFFILSALCAGAVMFSASRGSFGSLIIGAIYLVYRYSKRKGTFLKICISSILIMAVTYPIWNSGMAGLEKKQTANENAGGTFNSRSIKWGERIKEFEYSPLYGVGFSAQNPNSKDYWNRENGAVEPGSSWLAILSMTGFIGFSLFAILFYKAFIAVKNSKNESSVFLISLLMFLAVHMVIEGYIFAAGNPVCLIAWLIIGCCYDKRVEIVQNRNT